MTNPKSIFDALNKMKKGKIDESSKEEKNESWGAINKAGSPVKKTGAKISKDDEKVGFVYKNRKKVDNKKPYVDKDEDTDGDNIGTEDEEQDSGEKSGFVMDESIEIEEEDLNKIGDVLEALKVPDNILESFRDRELEVVFEYLDEEYGIKFSEGKKSEVNEEEVDPDTEEDEQQGSIDEKEEEVGKVVKEGKKLYKLKDGVKFGIVEDNIGSADITKWDSSVLIYEGGVDKVVFERMDNDSYRFVFKEEGVDREIVLDDTEANRIFQK